MIKKALIQVLTYLPSGIRNAITKKYFYNVLKKKADLHIEGFDNAKGVEGPIVFIGNHLSNADGVLLAKALKDYDPTFVAGVKLEGNRFTKLALDLVKYTPIKAGTADKEGLKKIIAIAKQNENLFIFPEGTRSRDKKMIKAKRGLYLILRMTKAKVCPIALTGTENFMPINNEAMDKEGFHHAKITLKMGKPFDLRDKREEETKREYEENVVDECMVEIAKLLPKEYRGVYDFDEEQKFEEEKFEEEIKTSKIEV